MGHLVGKDIYRKLGRKIDGLSTRAPWNDTLYKILKELYTAEEAELVVRMPYGLADIDKIGQVTSWDRDDLQRLLDGLSEKGLVIDIWAGERYFYTLSPFIIGIFEFTMMRTRGELNSKEWAGLFRSYLEDDQGFFRANFGKGQTMSPLRALPHEEVIGDADFVEILDYEKASAIVDKANKMTIGICSCRHEKMHLGTKTCDIPLETCSSFNASADYLISHGMAREVSKSEMRENLARSRESGLVFCADNVKKDVSFICHCCSCCCNVILGFSRMGYPGVLVSSTFLARNDPETCLACGSCVENCPFKAITMDADERITVDEDRCVGCGVCALGCDSESLRLVKRERRVFHPEDTFERLILQHLEQGNLQNLIFSNPQSGSHAFMRGLVGGFLRLPPVKKALASDRLRSSFLSRMRQGA
ncbi:MAG: 4Fe-4S binding protein [bacterium]